MSTWCWLAPSVLTIVQRCRDHDVVRSNYTSPVPNRYGEYPTHYKSLDAAMRAGLVMRVGRYYRLTNDGLRRTGL